MNIVKTASRAQALVRPFARPLAIVGAVIGTGAVLRWQLARLFTEKPDFVLEERRGPLELRRYGPALEAQTVVDDDWDSAVSEGFKRLAGYIGGKNHVGKSIPVTSPMTAISKRAARSHKGEKIKMTAPVLSEHRGDGVLVSFVLPEGKAHSTLPEPDDRRVAVVEVPARRVAVLCWSGRYHAKKVAEQEAKLLEEVKERGLIAVGPPSFAGYDPPSTLPLLRHNEVQVEILGE